MSVFGVGSEILSRRIALHSLVRSVSFSLSERAGAHAKLVRVRPALPNPWEDHRN